MVEPIGNARRDIEGPTTARSDTAHEGADGGPPTMSLATMLPVRASAKPTRPRRGHRRRIEDDPIRRMLHFAVATARLVYRKPYKEIARDFEVSDRSIREWCKAVPHYEDAPPYLRRFASAD